MISARCGVMRRCYLLLLQHMADPVGYHDEPLFNADRTRIASDGKEYKGCTSKYKIKSITWQTTPYLCGNLLFYDCVQRVKIKVYHFPIYGNTNPCPFFNLIFGRSFNLWRFVCLFVPSRFAARSECGSVTAVNLVMRTLNRTAVQSGPHLFWFVWNANRCLLRRIHVSYNTPIIIHCSKLLMVDNRFSLVVYTPVSLAPYFHPPFFPGGFTSGVQTHTHIHTGQPWCPLFGQITIV